MVSPATTSSTSTSGTPPLSAEDRTRLQSALYSAGEQVRREVVGDAYVDRSLAATASSSVQTGDGRGFSMPMQEIATSFAWGSIWTRPGLARRDRSILNIGMLAALNRNTELGTHIRGALNNGLSVEEIQECLLQVSAYVGMPAGMESFRVAEAAILEWTAQQKEHQDQNQKA
ncbi:CMD-domain-containing protein [Testicularia cyperi]|uniref:CMD-domain-containing protein n=1 Tax=Testicularia cyperi TaxID=1882483 RepID=A0A317XN52_9BASI|nr:CMD-domain-containing protein [Testicularia cyperi]